MQYYDEQAGTMKGAILPGDSTVEIKDFPIPSPGPGQVLVRIRASSICGSDIRCIYREHLGKGPEGYQPGLISGHEPAGEVVELGENCKDLKVGDRVVVYHITGCGCCRDCKEGYMISCTSEKRAAHGWQRDGGHAPFMVTEENVCVKLPDSLSFIDGAFCACGFGTSWEALMRMGIDGSCNLLVTGLGPVGLAAAMLGRALGAQKIFGTDISDERIKRALGKGLVDFAYNAANMSEADIIADIEANTGGHKCERSIDCSAAPSARVLAIKGTRRWGRCAFVGEGNNVDFMVSEDLIHPQITLYGSWVTSTKNLEDLVEFLDRKGLNPQDTSDAECFMPLEEVSRGYEMAAAGDCGKVCIVF
jgi:threonine dehydrogenase-like Zn-dependent dehydrogenase